MKTITSILAIALLATAAVAKDTWEDRLRRELGKAEVVAATFDDLKAVKNVSTEERLKALHARVAALEKARDMETPPLVLKAEDASSRLQLLSAAVVGMSSRLRKVKLHDSPPAVTPSKPSATPTPKGPKPTEPKGPVKWPEELRVNATSSVDYQSTGEWAYRMLYPTRYDRQEYRLLGYEGRFHFSMRLVGLLEEVKSVDVVLIVTGGTGPFRFSKKPRYEFHWKARHRHMWNGALKKMVNYDTWHQAVSPRWGGFRRTSALRPSVRAYISELKTKEGRIVKFKVPE